VGTRGLLASGESWPPAAAGPSAPAVPKNRLLTDPGDVLLALNDGDSSDEVRRVRLL